MFRLRVLWFFVFFVICSYCGKDFVTLGRHQWRCKKRMPSSHGPNDTINITMPAGKNPANIVETVKCCCGKACKGAKGLKMHQRRCRILEGLNEDPLEIGNSNLGIDSSLDETERDSHVNMEDIATTKPGILLPKTSEQWNLANDYFKSVFNDLHFNSDDIGSIYDCVSLINNTIYSYFKDHYGTVRSHVEQELVQKYNTYSVNALKKALKQLKLGDAPLAEIQYVSRLLRSKLKHSALSSIASSSHKHHDRYISKNFWGFVKNVVDRPLKVLPSFSGEECTNHFLKMFSSTSPNRQFPIPSWIPALQQTSIPFNLEPPSYDKITNVIRRMKASGSPCPLDQISIICFKRCPYLRSVITRLICSIWKSGNIPHKWKKACAILVHKKGDKDDPANFRPITLESVPLKIFTSCLRDSIFSFLSQNHLIEQKIQKGFTHGVSGVLEHTSMMAYLINKARVKQRSAIITLLDLKNAFGEVHHNLIKSVLAYHHVPEAIQSLVTSLYTDFHSYIISDGFSTPAIPFKRGVLQGDCLSPLLFNMCFNTFIQFVKQEKYNQLGFSPHDETDRLFHPVHWFQFADDAAVITTNERENQLLLNCFSRWCQWASMLIRVDKCITFGIKKFSTSSLQFQPKLFINSKIVPPVRNGESFKYLGRFFNL